jgi:hypothetical protein
MSAYDKTFPLGEICSVSKETKSADPTDPARRSSSSGMAACAFCTLHADHPGILPPVASSMFAVAIGREVYPSLFYQAPYRLAVWSSASPRGPPAFS